jgi:hypothetical protein
MKSLREVINKLILDTNDGKIKWKIDVEKIFVRATYEKMLTSDKKITFKIVFYPDHTKGTKLHINFIRKKDGVNSSNTIMDIGGSKKKEEVRLVLHLLKKIIEKVGFNLPFDELNMDDDDDEIQVSDRVEIIKEQDFRKEECIGQKGTVIKEFNKGNKIFFLVEFDEQFSSVLVGSDFDFNRAKAGFSDGKCWLMDPNNLKKIKDKKVTERLLLTSKEFSLTIS